MKNMSSEQVANELIAAIARLQSERDKLRELLQRLIGNVETGSNESTGQCIDECKRTLRL